MAKQREPSGRYYFIEKTNYLVDLELACNAMVGWKLVTFSHSPAANGGTHYVAVMEREPSGPILPTSGPSDALEGRSSGPNPQ